MKDLRRFEVEPRPFPGVIRTPGRPFGKPGDPRLWEIFPNGDVLSHLEIYLPEPIEVVQSSRIEMRVNLRLDSAIIDPQDVVGVFRLMQR